MHLHLTKLRLRQNHTHHHHNRQDRVKVIGDSPDKDGKAVFSLYKARHSRRPRGYRGYDTHRRRRSVNQISQLCTGYLKLVRHRTHYASYRQTVKIIVDKDQHTE